MCRVSKRMTTIIFFDFSKVFYSIDRRAISIVLSKYGVSELLIAYVMQFYIGTSAAVATAHGNTENFSTTSGVLQGDSLAPFLFITLLDYVLRETILTTLMVSLLLPVEVHVIQQFELVLSCIQTTSQSLATQLNKPKMFFDASK